MAFRAFLPGANGPFWIGQARYPLWMEICDLTAQLSSSEFRVFSETAAAQGVIRGIKVEGGGSFTRRQIDNLSEQAQSWGAKGLMWLAVEENQVRSPIAKFLTEEEVDAITAAFSAEPGDLILMVAGKYDLVCDVLGRLRLALGRDLGLIDENAYNLLWVVDWPLLVYDEDAERYVAAHHPFTAPLDEDEHLLETDPGKCGPRPMT